MAHRNREKRAARKAREAEKFNEGYREFDEYDDEFDDDEYYDDDEYDDDDYDEPRRRRGLHPALVALIVTTVLVVGAFYSLDKLYESTLSPVEPGNDKEITVVIEEGASKISIVKSLMDHGLLKDGLIRGFITEYIIRQHIDRMYKDEVFNYGEFVFTKSMSFDEMAAILIEGVAVATTKQFTIPEGLTVSQVARTLAANGIVSEAQFFEEARNGKFDYPFLVDAPLGDERLEGFLYPETYEIYEDATAHDIIDKMLAQFDALFKTEYYAIANDMGMSVREVVTLASIVEREAVVAAERPIMARVFLNRLEIGMRLESCATIQYIFIINGEEPREFLLDADTQIPSPFNTYLNDGLPPGPICNPRMASIEAVLFPDDNDYVFFVLSDALDGSHRFSADYNEFLQNKDAYYQAVNAAG